MTTHTPGPWTFRSPYVVASGGTITTIKETKYNKANEANARLIAAAPDLLAALKALSAGLHDEIDMKAHIKAAEVRAARAAIAKAEEEQS